MAEKEVYFFTYCKTCIHRNTNETDDPCNECLANGSNEDSHTPVNYVEAKGESK